VEITSEILINYRNQGKVLRLLLLMDFFACLLGFSNQSFLLLSVLTEHHCQWAQTTLQLSYDLKK
jgi:hypothetical protein